jgi:hypothetical protein
MSMARLVITAVTIEGRSKSEVARDYGVSRVWVQKLVRRFHSEGEVAFEPRSRRPHSSPHAVEAEVEDAIIRLRKKLSKQGLDAGAETIAAHLARQAPVGGPACDAGRVDDLADLVPAAACHPRNRRNGRDHPGERFAPISPTNVGRPISPIGSSPMVPRFAILNILDDHSRLCLASQARRSTTSGDVSPGTTPD